MSGEDDIRRAAARIRAGGLVVFPTETVYGLGANALDPAAVERIFQVKGRPAASPLIVHVSDLEMARALVRQWPPAAEALARQYWPGPLTLILEKRPRVPDRVTAGLSTVGLRMPAHPLALELIRLAQVPIAGPSANLFTQLSPTTAEDARRALGVEVDCILDGGPAAVGIESTVLSLASNPPLLLRPGMISRADVEACIGPLSLAPPPSGPHASPGLHPRHYSPATRLLLAPGGELPGAGRGVYLYHTRPSPAARSLPMPPDPASYGAILYRTLHQLDRQGWDWIAVEPPPDEPEWSAIADRLRRAAAPAG